MIANKKGDVNTKLETTLKNISQHYDETSVEELNKDEKDFFVLSYKENKVLYKIEQKDNLLDSSAIAMSNWIEIAQDISIHSEDTEHFLLDTG